MGFIAIDRQIKSHWLYEQKPFCKLAAWYDLLLKASYKDEAKVIGNVTVEVKRGDVIVSLRQLASDWGWSTKKVSNFLSLLENDAMIETKKGAKKKHIIINKYNDFQDVRKQKRNKKETQKKHSKPDSQEVDNVSSSPNHITNKPLKLAILNDLSEEAKNLLNKWNIDLSTKFYSNYDGIYLNEKILYTAQMKAKNPEAYLKQALKENYGFNKTQYDINNNDSSFTEEEFQRLEAKGFSRERVLKVPDHFKAMLEKESHEQQQQCA